jgi:hypothetical protein
VVASLEEEWKLINWTFGLLLLLRLQQKNETSRKMVATDNYKSLELIGG